MAKTPRKDAPDPNGSAVQPISPTPAGVVNFIVAHGGRTSDMPMPDRKTKPAPPCQPFSVVAMSRYRWE